MSCCFPAGHQQPHRFLFELSAVPFGAVTHYNLFLYAFKPVSTKPGEAQREGFIGFEQP
jgi:hypothetical protein